ncbi:MAG TPA: ABC transporter permease [Vicinamibacterales bacterium]|nr:ABC transporter permease [Vicinamibacterales bacterium]
MAILAAIRVALAALWRNRLRTVLTMLGITIGIAAVICTVSLGQGSAAEVRAQLEQLGDNFVWIEAGSRNVGGVRTGAGGGKPLGPRDMDLILQHIPLVTACSPMVDARVQVVRGNQNWNTTYRGVSPDFLSIRRWVVESGTSFSDADVESRAHVCLLGRPVVDQLFPDGEDPVGETIRVNNLLFRVVGVLKAKGASAGQNQDDMILMPWTTAQRRIRGITWFDDIMCSTPSPELLPPVRDAIITLLRDEHGLAFDQANDFNVRMPEETLILRQQTAETMGIFLASVAGISLVVGGIGIMNIMLVSVTERTREIGLRMAIGARERDVMRQFLVEALVLGVLGGALGVSLGVGGSRLLTTWQGWPTVVTTDTVMIAVAVACLTGLVFGYYPARRAAKLDPIEALRFE